MANLLFQHKERKELQYSIDEEDEATIQTVELEGYVQVTQEPVEEEPEPVPMLPIEKLSDEVTEDEPVEEDDEIETPAEEAPVQKTTRTRKKKIIK